MTETTTNVALMGVTSADSGKPTGARTPADALGESKRMSTSESEEQESHECPSCGDWFNTDHALKVHHAHAHGESLVNTVACEWCGEEFSERPSHDRTFCSYECRSAHRSENGLPARSRQVTLTCDGCGEEFDVPQSDSEAGKKYCSMKCYANDSDARWLECEWCGEDFRAHGERVDSRRFCSQDCYGQWMSQDMPIEQHPRYKGEDKLSKPHYGVGWNESKREAVRERDDHSCVVCGLSGTRHMRQYGAKLNVHHIIPARQFDDPDARNAMDNLVTLCVSCHRKWEGIPLRPEVGK